jgi:beta-galactosidase GanA
MRNLASNPVQHIESVELWDDRIEKFAELIVQECASMARVFQAHEYDFTGDLDLDKFMLKHFGIEEK